jgi:phosphoribosylpyrophosphate synthetase
MRLFYQSVRLLQKELSVIAGPSSPDLAAKIAQDLGAELIPVDVRIFTDSESKIRMGNVKKKAVLLFNRHILRPIDTFCKH